MADEKATPQESEEEALERLRVVRATQIFGDTPTDPTIGDVVVPTHDEEGAGDNLARANADAEDLEGDERDDLLSDEEVKRQAETPQFDAAAEDLADREDDEDAGQNEAWNESGTDNPEVDDPDQDDDTDDDGDVDADDRKAADVIADIESASTVEEVDSLAAGDERVTVKRAADKRKDELSE